MLKRLLAAAPALALLGYGLAIGPRYDRFVLPAFDGYVYDAMADTPRVFTIAPWGYRILAPWIVHVLPASSAAAGYYWLNLVCLTASVLIVGLWLRRLGFGDLPAALAGLALAASPPIEEFLRYQVLVGPLGLLILTLTLLELLAPRLLVLAALFAAGGLTREECLIPIALLFVVQCEKEGWRRAMLHTLLAAVPALVMCGVLRATWGSSPISNEGPWLAALVGRLRSAWPLLLQAVAMSGVGLVALVGLGREPSWSLRAQTGLLWTLTFAAVFANPYHFSAADLPRLSASAWPAVLPLALAALGFKRVGREAAPSPRPVWLANAAAMAVLVVCATLVLIADPYERAKTRAQTDPIPFLARSRETLKTARALDQGDTFVFDARSGRFADAVTQQFNLTEGRRMRWFLYSGFAREATFGPGAPEFQGEAELLLPILSPHDASMLMGLEGRPDDQAEVRVQVGGVAIGTVRSNGSIQKMTVPRYRLFRGDNIVRLRGPAGVPVRLVRWEVNLEPRGPPAGKE